MQAKLQYMIIGLMFMVLGLVGFLVYQNRLVISVHQDQELKLVAEVLVSDHESAVGGIRQFLLALTENDKFVSSSPEICDRTLKSQTLVFQYFFNLGVVNEKGEIVCSGAPLRIGSFQGTEDFNEMVKSKRFTVSGYRISDTTGRPSVRFLQPFFKDDGKFAGAIFASFGAEWLNGFSPSFVFTDDSVITKFDKDGNVFMRYPNPLVWSGTNQQESAMFQKILENKEGIMEMQGLDGVSRRYYFRPVYLDGKLNAYIAVGKQ